MGEFVEAIIEPERPLCDPHHHLWDHAEAPYLLPELLADVGSGHHVVSTVFVECAAMYRNSGPIAMRPLGETEFVNGVAAMFSSGGYGEMRGCAGIVGFADMLLGEQVSALLDQHMALSPRFRGIRHSAAHDPSPAIRVSHSNPPPQLLLCDDFQAGFAELAPRGLSFDAWLYHPQLNELTQLARAFPGTTIVLDHCGGPLGIGPYAGKQDAIFSQWKVDIAALAACPNVCVKLGGLLMPVNGFRGLKEPLGAEAIVAATGHYYRHAISCFGPERCMFESNFPVDKRNCSYASLWNAFKIIAAGYSAADQDWLCHDTAVACYRLQDSP
jgi:L-fuconolactonase